MKALVTGASGFIGSTLIEELNTLGFEVSAMMRGTSNPRNLEGMKYQRVAGDLSDLQSLRQAVKGMDYVFHLAGLTAAPSREAYFEGNAAGTARLARAAAEERPGLSRFVYVSSLAAGGPSPSLDRPRAESEPEAPVSAYGASKLQGEHELLKFKNIYPISIVRPPMVYGPKERGIYVLIRTVSRGLMPIPKGKGEGGNKFYSLIHVRDLCRGIVQAGVAKPDKVASGEVFYMADDQLYSMAEILSAAAEKLDRQPIRIRLPQSVLTVAAAVGTAAGWALHRNLPLNWDKRAEVVPDFWICSNAKARTALGFAPEFDLGRGMADAIAWYRKHDWL